MLDSLKRFFSGPGPERDLTEITDWVQRRGYGIKRARGDDGFVIDGALEGTPWRIEWGPPQRTYLEGRELRLRTELDLPSHMQMLVLSRPLMDSLERRTFEEFTDNVQTQIGTKTPEEMRWLVMFPKVNLSTMKALRENFGAVASAPAVGLAWLEGPLGEALEQAANGVLRAAPPFVLMTLRGRAYLRMRMDVPESKEIAAALALFETAVAQALRVAANLGDGGEGADSDASTAWQSLHTDDPDPAKPSSH